MLASFYPLEPRCHDHRLIVSIATPLLKDVMSHLITLFPLYCDTANSPLIKCTQNFISCLVYFLWIFFCLFMDALLTLFFMPPFAWILLDTDGRDHVLICLYCEV